MKRSEDAGADFELNSDKAEPAEAHVSDQMASAASGGTAILGSVSNSHIESKCFQITSDKLPPEISEFLKQKKGIHIPYPRNANFTGRKTLIDDLRITLQSGDNVALTHTSRP